MKSLIVPTLKDPRLLLIAFFILLCTYTVGSSGFARTWTQFFVSASICITLDFALAWYFEDRVPIPVSGLLSSFGVFLLLDSPLLWPTALAAVVSIASKCFFRLDKHHVFNPSNFGVLMVSLAFPDYASVGSYRWAGSYLASIVLLTLGTALVIRVNRWRLCSTYVLTFLVLAVVRAFLSGRPLWAYFTTFLAPGMILFIFYMISDPRTSPKAAWRQIAFGVTLAFVDTAFRAQEIRAPQLNALFFLCLMYTGVRLLWPERNNESPWDTRLVPLEIGREVSPEGNHSQRNEIQPA